MNEKQDFDEADLPRNIGLDPHEVKDLLEGEDESGDAEVEGEEPRWPESRWGKLLHSLFVIPFFIALFGLIVAVLVWVLVADDRSVDDYLEDIQNSRGNKRWQAAFELSGRLIDTEKVPHDRAFIAHMIDLFDDETLKQDDPRVREYLALAMGRTGLREFFPSLMAALAEASDDEATAYIQALGLLGVEEAAPALYPYLENAESRLRLASVIAVGNIGADESVPRLREMLNDREPNVTWDAAIALAKWGDRSGRDILIRLMDREYFAGFKEVKTEERTRAMVVAIQAAAQLNDAELDAAIRALESDPNLKVQNAVRQAMSQDRAKSDN